MIYREGSGTKREAGKCVYLGRIAGVIPRWVLHLADSLEGARVVTGKESHRKHLGPLSTD